jgi:hypothetical protein
MLMREIKADDTRSLLAIIYAFDADVGRPLAVISWPLAFGLGLLLNYKGMFVGG